MADDLKEQAKKKGIRIYSGVYDLTIRRVVMIYIEDIGRLIPEVCICAAVKTECGKVIRGHRHGDCFHAIIQRRLNICKKMDSQGFITSLGRYVDRKEGARLQREAGIKSAQTGEEVKGLLFSEDLYFDKELDE